MGDSPSNDSGQEDTSDSFDANMGLSETEVGIASGGVDDFMDANIGSLPTSRSNLSDAAMKSARTDQSQSQDSQTFFSSDAVPDATDFNFANSQAAQQLQEKAKGLNIPSIVPGASLVNALTGLPSRMTLNALNRGQVPTYNADGQITGTTGQGFGMASPTGSVPGYDLFTPVTTITNTDMNMGDDNNEPQIIRAANPRDAVEEETRPPVSDDLAVNYLQDPFYLYSGQGNLYQPYGYAQNTLVDLLRTRNLTQPTQAAANLGLFGNPGDFM
tara:strand:- start:8539 stop:9354 length:816 start_codon:yes stop_codon:yes gene_type:complete